MKTFVLVGSFLTLAAGALVAAPLAPENGPKNLVSPVYRGPAPVATHEGLTRKGAKHLAAIAETKADHLKLAAYYRGEAGKFEAQSAAYETAAADFRSGPMIKNFAAPTTPARWEFAAKGFREEARSNQALAESHERMAAEFAGAGL